MTIIGFSVAIRRMKIGTSILGTYFHRNNYFILYFFDLAHIFQNRVLDFVNTIKASFKIYLDVALMEHDEQATPIS